jgi:aldehyde:ferredoxin oxidoreductase
MPPWRVLNEPIKIGDKEFPGIGEEGANKLLDEYYEERGWNIKEGRLSREKLEELGLADVASDLGY